MSHAVSCAVVDDEEPARELLRGFIAAEPGLRLAWEASSGPEALEAIASSRPDLLFLDIQMPEISGFDLLEGLPAEGRPLTVFVTAYDSYALQAFEVHALDYLLKPFDRERFRRAVRQALARIDDGRRARYAARLESLLAQRHVERIVVRSDGRLVPIPLRNIDWAQAEGNYVRLYVGGEVHLVRTTLRELADRLPLSDFVRVHRSAIVNIGRVSEVQPWYTGEYVIRLATGREITLSRTYRDAFFEALGKRD